MAASIKRIGELKRQVYRDFACGVALGDDIPDRDAPYWSIASSFSGERPATAEAQAWALHRLLQEEGIEAWVYRFGISDLFVHSGVIAQSDRGPIFQDAFTGLGFSMALPLLFDRLDQGEPPKPEPLGKDRKVCVLDVGADPDLLVQRIAEQADRELVGANGQRAFLLAWTPELYAASSPEAGAALDVLTATGAARSLASLMLHPVAVMDGDKVHIDVAAMPVVGSWFAGQDHRGRESRTASGERLAQMMEMTRMTSMNRLMQDLRRDLDSLRDTRSGGPAENDHRNERLASPRTAAARVSQLEADIANLQDELDSAIRRADQADASAKRRQAELDRLLDQSSADHAATQEALRRASEELRAERAALLDLHGEHDRTRHRLERATRESDAATRQLDEERARVAQFVADESAARAQILDLNRRLQEAVAERGRLIGEVDRLEQLSQDRDRLIAEQARLARELEQVRQERDEMSREVDRLGPERDRTEAERARLEREVERVRQGHDEMSREVDRLGHERDRLLAEQARLARDAEHERDKAGAEQARLAREVERLSQEYDAARRSVEAERERNDRTAQERDRLAQEIERLELRLAQLRAAGEDAEREADQRDRRIASLTQELEAALAAVQAEQALSAKRLEEESEASRRAVDAARERGDRATQERDELTAEIERLVAGFNQELEAAREESEREVEARERRIANLTEELEAASATVQAEQVSSAKRLEEERKLMQVAQARLERELRATHGELSARDREVQNLAGTIARLAYSPSQGQPVAAPDLGADARTQAAQRVEQRISELEHARAVAEAALQNHREILMNSRYFKARQALLRLVGR